MTTPRAQTHPLRWAIAIAFLPALVLNIIDAAVVGSGLPLIGIPVHLVSAIISIAYLRLGKPPRGNQEGVIRLGPSPDKPSMFFCRQWFLFFLDAIFMAMFLLILILRWIWSPRYAGQAVLATYAEFPFLLALICHAYLCYLSLRDSQGLRRLVEIFGPGQYCPHCEPTQHSQHPTTGSFFRPQHPDCDSRDFDAGSVSNIIAYRDETESQNRVSADDDLYAADSRGSHNPQQGKEVGSNVV